MMKKLIGLTVAVVLAVGTLTAAVAPSAEAATGWDRCPRYYFCVFSDTDGRGVMARFQRADANLADGFGPQGMNDNIESSWNRTGDYFLLYRDAYYAGGVTGAPPHDRFDTYGSTNNTRSSIKRG
jgi:hypothetical protein